MLLIAGDVPSRALVVAPDSGSADETLAAIPHPADVTLFSRAGAVQSATLPTVSGEGLCATGELTSAPPPRNWSVGFIGGVVSPLPIDSAASPADSAALAVWLNRLASALPNDTAGRFVGLPFVAHGLWRVHIPDGPLVVIGSLVRQINQEATPLQERTIIVAEQVPSDSSFVTAYSERFYGPEETIETTEVLAGALLGASRTPTLVVSRDFGDGVAYGTIERIGAGRWRARWTSGVRSC